MSTHTIPGYDLDTPVTDLASGAAAPTTPDEALVTPALRAGWNALDLTSPTHTITIRPKDTP